MTVSQNQLYLVQFVYRKEGENDSKRHKRHTNKEVSREINEYLMRKT